MLKCLSNISTLKTLTGTHFLKTGYERKSFTQETFGSYVSLSSLYKSIHSMYKFNPQLIGSKLFNC